VLLRELLDHKTIRTHDKTNSYVRRTYGTKPACRIVSGPYGVTYGTGTILHDGSRKAFEKNNSEGGTQDSVPAVRNENLLEWKPVGCTQNLVPDQKPFVHHGRRRFSAPRRGRSKIRLRKVQSGSPNPQIIIWRNPQKNCQPSWKAGSGSPTRGRLARNKMNKIISLSINFKLRSGVF
jgi:hypothetical protein